MTCRPAKLWIAIGVVAALAGCAERGSIRPTAQPLDANTLDPGRDITGAAITPAAITPAAVTPAAGPGGASTITAPETTQRWWQAYGDPQLDALVEIAFAQNPDLRIARDRIEQAQASAGAAGAVLWPKLDADGKFNRVHASKLGETPPPLNGKLFWDNNADLSLSYELDLWGKNRSSWQAALGGLRAAELDVGEARLSLQTALVRTYVRLSQAYAVRDVLSDTLEQQQQVLTITQRRYAAGLVSALQVSQAEAQVDPVRVRLEQADNSISALRNQLAALSGQGPGAGDALLRPALGGAIEVSLPSAVPAQLIGRRPDVIAARWRVEAAAHGIDAANAQFYPNINLSAFAGLQALSFDKLFGGDAVIYGYGPAITLPIFEGGRLRANLAGRTADYDLAVDRYNAALIQALQQVADEIAAVRSNARQRAQAQTALDTAQRAYDQALIGFRAGLTDYLTVLSTQTGLLAQRQTLAQIEAAQLDAYAALMQALGGGFSDDTDSAAALQKASAAHPAAVDAAQASDRHNAALVPSANGTDAVPVGGSDAATNTGALP